MSKKLFTEKEIKILSKNQYVKTISSKGITYTEEFKQILINQCEQGKFPREVFVDCGFDIDILGMERVHSSAKRWRKAFKNDGVLGLRDTRAGNSGRLRHRELSVEEKLAKLEAENNLLKAENELLKKIRFAERGLKKKR